MSRTNYASFTEQFANAVWATADLSVQSNIAGVLAPDGTATVDKLVEGLDSVATGHIIQQIPTGAVAQVGDPWTLSIYAKSAERTQIRLALAGISFGSSSRPNAVFELSTQSAAVISQLNGVLSPTMVYQGSGWWRVSISGVAQAIGNPGLNYQPCLSGNNIYVGNGSYGVYVWGAQLELGLIATPYIENETAVPLTIADTVAATSPIITGSAAYPIPLQVGTPQTLSIQLGGVTYQLTFLYRNDTSGLGGWTVDIADAQGTPILQGVPLVTGADLLAQYKHFGFNGSLFVQTTADPDAIPTFANLGDEGQIYWVSP